MLISAATIAKIKKIIEKNQARLLVGVLGPDQLTESEMEEIRRQGIQIPQELSALERIYYHNYINAHDSKMAPTNKLEMELQQNRISKLPKGKLHSASKDFLNSNMKQLIQKQKADLLSRIEGMIRDTNNTFKFENQMKLDDMIRENTMGQLKAKLRDLSGDANRNWDRIVNTEVSNAISLGSVDRLVDENIDKPLTEVYVYRIVVNDAALCKYCRQFYLDSDGTPKVYKLSSLLGNGSNYGKKQSEWKPVATATHPNERCSQVIELKPGFRVFPGGSVGFIGVEAWKQYISKKVVD